MYPLKMPSTNVFNELCVKISLPRSIPKEIITVCNAVYFRLCIDLMHILPPVTAEGFDGSHQTRFAECVKVFNNHSTVDSRERSAKYEVLKTQNYLPCILFKNEHFPSMDISKERKCISLIGCSV